MDERSSWRNRPYLDSSIDLPKALVIGILFIALLAWQIYHM